MKAQFFGSIAVGLAISAVLWLPLLVWQYRRYGRGDLLRMLWTFAGFIYMAAIVAFTIFPLPEFGPGYCEKYGTSPQLDILNFPKEVAEYLSANSAAAFARSPLLWEVALNVLLFVPFGVIVRRLFEIPRSVVVVLAFLTSLLIEATQLTGNWGLAPCSYRVPDVTDLVSNTSGAVIGLVVERVTPRLLSKKEYLLEHREKPRPVSRFRRLVGMLLDVVILFFAAAAGNTLGSAAHRAWEESSGSPVPMTVEQAGATGTWIAGMLVVLIPAMITTGASLGQRIVFLCPWSGDGSRLHLLWRALSVQGLILTTFRLGAVAAILGVAWTVAAIVTVLFTRRGLSGLLSGCDIVDSRLLVRADGPATGEESPRAEDAGSY
ncbi:VanZ family protein [Corynebacterium sp. 335C]